MVQQILSVARFKQCILSLVIIGIAHTLLVFFFYSGQKYGYSFMQELHTGNLTHQKPDPQPFFNKKHAFDCAAIFDGDEIEARNASQRKRPIVSDYRMSQIFSNCTLLRNRNYYPVRPLSKTEADFPLAYVIMLNEHLEQIELMFNSIYAPQNLYCFHVDSKASYLFHAAINKLAKCFPKNVLIFNTVQDEPLPLARETVYTLHAITKCYEKLLKFDRSWKYVLTLQGHDFPLRTNREIVDILTMYDGMNDVELTHSQSGRYRVRYEEVHDQYGQPIGISETNKTKTVFPYPEVKFYKGNVAGTFSREFAKFVLENNVSRALLQWLNDTQMPDELYLSTLNHNEVLQPPGGYPGRCVHQPGHKTWVSRFSVWYWYAVAEDRNISCKGEYRNSVCVYSNRDLPMLARRPELFCNKFWLPNYPVAVDCMHERLYNRTYFYELEEPTFTEDLFSNSTYDLPYRSYYETLAAVQFAMWKKEHPNVTTDAFQCVFCTKCEH